jgi:hypothetical protein
MIERIGLVLAVVAIALVAAAAVPVLQVVSVYREWNWEGKARRV